MNKATHTGRETPVTSNQTTYADYTDTATICVGDVLVDCITFDDGEYVVRSWTVVDVKADGRIGVDNGAECASEIAKVGKRPRVSYYKRTSRNGWLNELVIAHTEVKA